LEFGSSFNALGAAKQTKISVMGTAEGATVIQRLSEQVRMAVRYVEGRRVVYESFEVS
jgi:metal-sulfur cluster biosynthetic enzyme